MTYYILTNKETGWYFCNKSNKPEVSVRHLFNRAKNPNRADYNEKLSQDLRTYGPEGYIIEYSDTLPEGVEKRAKYMPPNLNNIKNFKSENSND